MIEETTATRTGECHLCGDIVNIGDPVVYGDEDDPYLHPDCLRRDIQAELAAERSVAGSLEPGDETREW